jgi:predicted XRE-type DNA-binding protein
MTTEMSIEQTAAAAISQARLLAHQANLAADTAIQQAVTLLLDSGMAQRAVAQMTGVSKSSVARMAKSRPPLGAVVGLQTDARVYAFANEWIWGSQENARAVADQLLQVGERPGGDVR